MSCSARVKLWASAFGGEIKSIAAKYSGSQLLQKVSAVLMLTTDCSSFARWESYIDSTVGWRFSLHAISLYYIVESKNNCLIKSLYVIAKSDRTNRLSSSGIQDFFFFHGARWVCLFGFLFLATNSW